jgi:carboxypeptidase-like protein
VLDSHGPNSGDHGFVWISYSLVSHNLDAGAVIRAYTVSFEPKISHGPNASLLLSSSSDYFKVEGKVTDSTVTGKITDNTGQTIPNASVKVTGTNKGTYSDINGNFTLNVPKNGSLNISYVGYRSQNIKIPNEPTLFIQPINIPLGLSKAILEFLMELDRRD